MNAKGNQYRQKVTRLHGGEDQDWQDKRRVTDILEGMGYECLTNLYLIRPRDPEMTLWELTGAVSDTKRQGWKLVARPDVAAWPPGCKDRNLKDVVLFEVDGAVHRKDLDERPLYTELGIDHVIINKEYLKKIDCPWEQYVMGATVAILRSRREARD